MGRVGPKGYPSPPPGAPRGDGEPKPLLLGDAPLRGVGPCEPGGVGPGDNDAARPLLLNAARWARSGLPPLERSRIGGAAVRRDGGPA